MFPQFNFLKKNIKPHLKLYVVFFAIIFIQFSHFAFAKECQFDLTSEEKVWMEKFFRDVMLDQSAIYTVWGSKPMTKIDIHYYTDEEIEEINQQMSEEEKKTGVIVDDYDLPENWEKWEKIESRFPLCKYLFFKIDDEEEPKFASIYFVNIAATEKVLKKNYKLFKQETGINFDISQVMSELKIPSAFWDKVRNSSLLVGILYGFGLNNAFSFTNKYSIELGKSDPYRSSLTSRFSDTPKFGKVSISSFAIPIFASFAKDRDPIIEKFKKERRKIQRIYRSNDFVSLTLQKLTNG